MSKKNEPKKESTSSSSMSKIIFLNIALLICGGIVLTTYMQRSEIEWLFNMLKTNYATIKKYPNASVDDRLAMKLGYNYSYFSYVCQNTPKDAVILFPSAEVFLREGTQFTNADFTQLWMNSLIYPRKAVVYSDSPEMPTNITHVGIINGWGFDKVNYPLAPQNRNFIAPINNPKNQ